MKWSGQHPMTSARLVDYSMPVAMRLQNMVVSSLYMLYIYDQHTIFHVTFGDTQLALAPCDNKDAICVRYSIDAM